MRNPVKRYSAVLCCTVLVASFLAVTTTVFSAQRAQQTFASPGKAVQAMYEAAKNNDKAELTRIFGPQSKELFSSGDPNADREDRDRIMKKYEEMHRLVIEPDKTVKLYVGAENWPFPIPLVQKNGVWFFDTTTGKREVLYRRIGRNEFSTVDVLGSLYEAQREYASRPRDGAKVKQFAQKFISDPGRENGLYWKPSAGEPPSPIGPLIAEAGKTYTRAKEGPTPFHGYYYRMLSAQGNSAHGGAKSFMSNGKMIHGFAILAYPAQYRNSGVMTFLLGPDGRIYQKDLKQQTESVGRSMTTFNPDKTWQVVE